MSTKIRYSLVFLMTVPLLVTAIVAVLFIYARDFPLRTFRDTTGIVLSEDASLVQNSRLFKNWPSYFPRAGAYYEFETEEKELLRILESDAPWSDWQFEVPSNVVVGHFPIKEGQVHSWNVNEAKQKGVLLTVDIKIRRIILRRWEL